MNDDPHDEEPWDEDRWERAFQENDRRTDKLLLLQEAFRAARPAPPDGAPQATRAAWERSLDRFLARQMGWDDLADDLDRLPTERPWAEDLSPDLDAADDPSATRSRTRSTRRPSA